MRSIRRILFAIRDPLTHSVGTLNKAAQLARALNAHLELFYAISWPVYTGPAIFGDRFDELKARIETRMIKPLEKLARDLESSDTRRRLRVSAATEWDLPPYEAIIRQALSTRADLIIAEPHRERRYLPLLHFNDWELLRKSPIPVLLLKRRRRYKRPVVLAAVDPENSTDQAARLDRAILDLSQTVAQALGGQLHAIHAYAPVPSGGGALDALDRETASEVNRHMAATAQQCYQRLLRRYPVRGRRRHLVAKPAVAAIEETARHIGSDIVTLGVVSRSTWRRLLVGRSAEALLDGLSCDLLVVKPPGFRVRVARNPFDPIAGYGVKMGRERT